MIRCSIKDDTVDYLAMHNFLVDIFQWPFEGDSAINMRFFTFF